MIKTVIRNIVCFIVAIVELFVKFCLVVFLSVILFVIVLFYPIFKKFYYKVRESSFYEYAIDFSFCQFANKVYKAYD